MEEAEKYCDDGQFPAMLPKVKACVNFVNGGGEAIIIEKTSAAIKGESRTKIIK